MTKDFDYWFTNVDPDTNTFTVRFSDCPSYLFSFLDIRGEENQICSDVLMFRESSKSGKMEAIQIEKTDPEYNRLIELATNRLMLFFSEVIDSEAQDNVN